MRDDFQRWYEAVQLTLNPEVMETRLTAVQALAATVIDAELEALVRAAFRSDQITAETGMVRAKMGDKGGAPADEEFALLAAATLAAILDQNDSAAARAATMIGTAHFNGLRTVRQPMDLVGLAASSRRDLARTTRSRTSLLLEPIAPLVMNATKAKVAEEIGVAISLLAEEFSAVMSQFTERQARFENLVLRYIDIQDEELNMLWWLQGGRTKAGQLFTEIARDHQPFLLARDLAEATLALPGAAAIGSLLERAGIENSEPLEVAAAIQSLPIDWLKAALPEANKHKASPVTTPLHEGIKRRLEVRGADSWIAGWAGVCDIDKAARLTPLQLADHCYCEQLLIHS